MYQRKQCVVTQRKISVKRGYLSARTAASADTHTSLGYYSSHFRRVPFLAAAYCDSSLGFPLSWLQLINITPMSCMLLVSLVLLIAAGDDMSARRQRRRPSLPTRTLLTAMVAGVDGGHSGVLSPAASAHLCLPGVVAVCVLCARPLSCNSAVAQRYAGHASPVCLPLLCR